MMSDTLFTRCTRSRAPPDNRQVARYILHDSCKESNYNTFFKHIQTLSALEALRQSAPASQEDPAWLALNHRVSRISGVSEVD